LDELNAQDAAFEGGEVQKDIFAKLLMSQCFIFDVLGGRFGYRTFGRLGWELTRVGFEERVFPEEALGDALKGPFFHVEEAVGVEGV
jgi:hypothetical protein